MPSKKKQHYVPKFYLRNFSLTKGSINIFNLLNKRNILDGSLRDQCYQNYFYGEDLEVENFLEKVDTTVAPIIANIINTHVLPKEFSDEHLALAMFIVTQYNRTKFAADSLNDATDKLFKNLLRDDPDVDKNELSDVIIRLKNPLAFSVPDTALLTPIIMDLKMHIFINSTSINFITSDNPVFFYNQYSKNMTGTAATGFSSQGLQIFLPLSPRVLLLLYDPKIYKVGTRAAKVTELQDIKDVQKLNKIQWMNALENIYYFDQSEAEAIERDANKIKSVANRAKAKLEEYRQVHSLDDTERSILHIYQSKPNIRLDLSVMHIQRRKKKIPLDERNQQMRNPELVRELTEWRDAMVEEISKGKHKPT